MKANKTIIANWKMYKTHAESLAWIDSYGDLLEACASKAGVAAVLCPTFTALESIAHRIKANTHVKLGAQDCSAYISGNHTGGVSALSLKELGCAYCIVGHSESRRDLGQANEIVAEKAVLLLDNDIIPVVCIGEPKEHMPFEAVWACLENQLAPVLNELGKRDYSGKSIYIAYEPHWAIGGDKTPTVSNLDALAKKIKSFAASACPVMNCRLLYGGSVTVQTAEELKKVVMLDGFLVGRASCEIDFLTHIIRIVQA